MSLLILSTDWRFKEKFKHHFSAEFLKDFSMPSKLIKLAEQKAYDNNDCIILDEKLGTSNQLEILNKLQENGTSIKTYLFIDKDHGSPSLPSVDFPLEVIYKANLDYEEFFCSFNSANPLEYQTVGEEILDFQSRLIGNSKCMQNVREKLALYSKSECSIHLFGETGTGKEIAANSVHHAKHPKRNIISINCSLLEGSLAESIFFGHAKGAFTDGKTEVEGLVGEANGSSLFLDEIENLSLSSQANMLRLLETGQYRRLGDPRIRHSSFRLITASNKNLNELMETNHIRKDFFYRITDTTIGLPPLREHKEDIAQLSTFYINKHLPGKHLSKEDLALLELYNWPGNVRQLFSVLKRGGIRCGKKETLELSYDDFT
ncbi:sigma 54-interacting transcriptional regulator [uncultured Sphaerochaeta sp.]|uniref:sigma 54-interacting transcriptional regulator n=1 Tax=uncultured Sphaerochaeta sp. TaxID=886478 RepID=UPI002A0A8BCC|nr:sigma 54-interacting transcriptional regulator [uncultured Sphaerochaeta sp.]